MGMLEQIHWSVGMKTLVIYDSQHGNTQRVAQVIGEALASEVRHVSKISPAELAECELLVIGSPTNGGFPTGGIHNLLKGASGLKNTRAAVFDTRAERSLFGFAAPKMANSLKKAGAELLSEPQGFIVLGIQGPLMDGELQRAVEWAHGLVR